MVIPCVSPISSAVHFGMPVCRGAIDMTASIVLLVLVPLVVWIGYQWIARSRWWRR